MHMTICTIDYQGAGRALPHRAEPGRSPME